MQGAGQEKQHGSFEKIVKTQAMRCACVADKKMRNILISMTFGGRGRFVKHSWQLGISSSLVVAIVLSAQEYHP